METNAPLARVAGYTWRILLVAAGVVAALWVFDRLKVLFLPVIVAAFLTTILTGPVKSITRLGVPRLLSTWIVLLGSLGVVVGGVVLMAPEVRSQFEALGPTLEEARETVEDWLITGPLEISRDDLEQYAERGLDALGERSGTIFSSAVSGAVLVTEVLAGIILAFVLTFFFLKDGDKMCAWFVGLLREEHRDLARALGRRVWTAGGGYVRGTAFVALVDAVFIAIGLVIIGVPLVLPLAILTFIGGFLPLVGATVAGIIAVLVALVDGGLGPALATGGVVIAVQQIEGDLLQPLVMARAVRLHPVAILGTLTAGALVGNIVGAFLAVPLAAVVVSIGAELRERNIIGPGRPRTRMDEPEADTPVEARHDPGPPDGFRTDGSDDAEPDDDDGDEGTDEPLPTGGSRTGDG